MLVAADLNYHMDILRSARLFVFHKPCTHNPMAVYAAPSWNVMKGAWVASDYQHLRTGLHALGLSFLDEVLGAYHRQRAQ